MRSAGRSRWCWPPALRHEFALSESEIRPLLAVIAVAVAAQIVIGVGLQTTAAATRRTRGRCGELTATTALVGCVLFLVDFFVRPQPVPQSVPLLAVPIAVLLAVGSRLVFGCTGSTGTARPQRSRRVIITVRASRGQQLLRLMLSDPAGILSARRVLDDDRMLTPARGCPCRRARHRGDVAAAAARSQADLLVIADRVPAHDAGERDRERGERRRTRRRNRSRPLSEMLKPLPVGPALPSRVPRPTTCPTTRSARPRRRPGRRRRVVAPVKSRTKRVFDVTTGLVSVVILLPLLLLIALLLHVAGHGVIYRAPRIGRDGQPFTMLKFVTMVPGDSGRACDRARMIPRITPLGPSGCARASSTNAPDLNRHQGRHEPRRSPPRGIRATRLLLAQAAPGTHGAAPPDQPRLSRVR
jgi:hypothetical protein